LVLLQDGLRRRVLRTPSAEERLCTLLAQQRHRRRSAVPAVSREPAAARVVRDERRPRPSEAQGDSARHRESALATRGHRRNPARPAADSPEDTALRRELLARDEPCGAPVLRRADRPDAGRAAAVRVLSRSAGVVVLLAGAARLILVPPVHGGRYPTRDAGVELDRTGRDPRARAGHAADPAVARTRPGRLSRALGLPLAPLPVHVARHQDALSPDVPQRL